MAEVQVDIGINAGDLNKALDGLNSLFAKQNQILDGLQKTINECNSGYNQVSDSINKNTEAVNRNYTVMSYLYDSLLDVVKSAAWAGVGFVAFGNILSESAQRSLVLNTAVLSTAGSFTLFGKKVSDITGGAMEAFANKSFYAKTMLDDFAKTSGEMVKTGITLNKNIFAVVESMFYMGSALTVVGSALKQTDSQFARVTGSITFIAGVALVSLSTALIVVIEKISNFAFVMGSKLVSAFQAAADSFANLESSFYLMSRQVESFGRVYTNQIPELKLWNMTISGIADTTGVLKTDLQRATTEIVSTTGAMGLQSTQMLKLLSITTDYEKILHRGLLQTTIDFISAINGNAQAVLQYGVKLRDADVAHYLLTQGITKSYQAMTNAEKVQYRYNYLLQQYAPVAGLAADSTKTLNGQTELFHNNQVRLQQALGVGAALIEKNNILTFAYNAILDNVNSRIVMTVGFFGALGARILQIGGWIVEHSLYVLAVVKAYELLNIAMKSMVFQEMIASKLPLLGKSFLELATAIGMSKSSFTSVKDLMLGMTNAIFNNTRTIIAAFIGVEAATLSWTGLIGGLASFITTKLIAAIVLLKNAFFALAANPYVAVGTALVAVLFAMYRAFEAIEERTGMFSKLLAVMGNALENTATVFEPVLNALKSFGNYLVELGDKTFGYFVAKVNSALTMPVKGIVALNNKLNFLSKDTARGLQDIINGSNGLNNSLASVNYQMSKLPENASRALAGNKTMNEELLKQIAELEKTLKDAGKTELQVLNQTLGERKKMIQDAYSQGIIGETKYQELLKKVMLDYSDKKSKIIKEQISGQASEFDTLRKNLQSAAMYDLDKVQVNYEQQATLLKKGLDSNIIKIAEYNDLVMKLEKQLIEDKKKAALESYNNSKGSMTPLMELISGQRTTSNALELQTIFLGAGVGFANAVKGGAVEFTKTAVKAAGAFAAAIVGPLGPVIGQAISDMIDIFGQAPEQFQQMIMDTFANLPQLISNIIINIVDLLAGKFIDKVLVGFIERLPLIAEALTYALVTRLASPIFWTRVAVAVVAAFIRSIPEIIQGFIDGFRKGIGDVLEPVKKVFEYLYIAGSFLYDQIIKIVEPIKSIFNAIMSAGNFLRFAGDFLYNQIIKAGAGFVGDIIKGAGRFIDELVHKMSGGILGGGGGGGIFGSIIGGASNVISSIGGAFGFAKGGVIYANSGLFAPRGTDTIPAMYTPGEMVIDRSTTKDLQRYLDNNGNSDVTNALLLKIVDLLEKPITTDAKVNFNNKTLADIILQLNRSNARLTA